MVLDNALREAIYKLRSSAYVVLVTGNMDCFTRFTVPALKLDEVFDKIVVSSDLGYLKTEKDGESFLAALREFGVPIHDSFLIDDSLNTCNFFAGLGGRAIHVSGKETANLALENLRQFVRIKQ
ncbi:MAG: HAD family hydrolase [Patescibacteria group bacterium]|jgi:FMN phosphatase YigB (HAD superfamily)